MSEPGTDSANAAREAFLQAYKADLEAGCIRPLAEYQSHFPGHEESIADEWRWLEPATLGSDPTHPCPPDQQKIGDYRIIEELGHGAQATVYLAEHETLRRQVALKVLRAPLTDGTSRSEQRFRREAEVTASIEHPNICSVYEAGSSDGATWIAMQYVPGSTLATHLMKIDGTARDSTVQLPGDSSSDDGSGTASTGAAKRSDLMRVVAFAEQAARALHVAHERGLVHRDIKPGNLMVTEDGKPVILDFGLARAADRDGSVDGLGLTRTNDVLGTPYYMAPEQLRSGTGIVDRRVDVYALGVTLFECLTRQRPFVGVSVEALYQQILTVEPPAPRSINPHIPRDLEVVLLTAIEKDRNRRYQTALDLAEDLRRVRQYEPIRARPISNLGRVVRLARRHPGVAASLSAAVVSLVAGLVVSLLFLQEANAALSEKDAALASWYDTVSQRAASDNMQGGITLMLAKLRERAMGEINRKIAGFGDEVAAALKMVRDGRPGTSLEVFVGILRKARDDLDPVGQHAVADLLLPVLKTKMGSSGFARDRASLAADLAGQHLELLHDLPSTDDRKIRARIMLLDVLNRNGSPAKAEELVRTWLEADESLPVDTARVALYETRRAASLLGIGRKEEAYELLHTDRTVAKVIAAYPHTWYSNDAQAILVDTLDQTGRSSETARRALGESLRRSLGHKTLGHHSWYAIRMLFGDAHRELLKRLAKLSVSPIYRKPIDVDGILGALRHASDDVVACAHLHFFVETANNLGMSRADPSLPTVGRLTRLAAEHAEALTSCHYSARVRAYKQHADYLKACGRYEEARDWLERRTRELEIPVAERWTSEWKLGPLLSQLGDYEDAERVLRRSLEEARNWYGPKVAPLVQTRNNLARLYRMWGDLPEAVSWHRKGFEENPGRHFELLFLASTYLQFGEWSEAEKTLRRALAIRGGRTGAAWRLAQLRLLRGNYDEAIAQAKQARQLGAAAVQAAKRTRRAALAGNAMRGAERIQAMALFARQKQGDVKAALGFFAKAAAGPKLVTGDGFWSDYGAALVADKKADEARALLKSLTDERKEDALAWHARARFLAETAGLTDADRAEAVRCAEKANELCQRRRAFVLAMLAEAQFHTGDNTSARTTAAEVKKLMAGRDAQWLSVKEAAKQFARYK